MASCRLMAAGSRPIPRRTPPRVLGVLPPNTLQPFFLRSDFTRVLAAVPTGSPVDHRLQLARGVGKEVRPARNTTDSTVARAPRALPLRVRPPMFVRGVSRE